MFELLFKYSKSTWQHAELVFASGWSWPLLLLSVLAVALIIILTLIKQNLSIGRRLIVATLQFIALAVALTMLWQPSLRIELMQAGENTVAYLLDTSSSMLNKDNDSQTRLASASGLLESDSLVDNGLFDANAYSMGETLQAIELPLDANVLSESPDSRSAIGESILTVLESVNEQALAAVVVMSDGADNASDFSSEWWQKIKAAGVPIHTIGFGDALVANDVELRDVSFDPQVSENVSVSARIHILHNGHDTVRVRVEAGEELLHAENIELDSGLSESVHNIKFNSGDAGTRELKISLQSDKAESNVVNNQQSRILNVADEPRRILYVEGEPRWEYKFLRRAVHDFKGIEIVSLLRTSPNKFYRQGVRSPQELVDGFPKKREELFQYDAIIIGSLEAAELSVEQQANLRDFVSERGGTLLMLAGREALGDGGWGRSAVSVALPVSLSARANARGYERRRVSVQPSTQGLRTPWLRLAEDDDANLLAWSELPALADVQPVGEPKPGSTVLLTSDADRRASPLLVWHRYGQGMSFVLGTSGTWRWQMGMPVENQSHELFWQQMLSHIAAGALPRLSVNELQSVYRDVKDIPIAVTARQENFDPLGDGELPIVITSPSGAQVSAVLTADIDEPGRYIGSIPAAEDGPYAVNIELPSVGEAQIPAASTSLTRWLVKESDTAEQFDTGLHEDFLQRVSSVTGGQYLTAANKDKLAELLATQNAGITREELLPLWNMPVLFLLLFLAKAIEWLLRLNWKRL